MLSDVFSLGEHTVLDHPLPQLLLVALTMQSGVAERKTGRNHLDVVLFTEPVSPFKMLPGAEPAVRQIVGREIAVENGLEKRVSYQAVNFLQDDIPSGFDMVLECDVGIYNETLFRKIHKALNPGGRFVILDYQFETEAASRLNLMGRAFFNSLENRHGVSSGPATGGVN